ncbi:DNA polymerase mu [Ephemerocybe angulata]|uniref:DNA polymerase mu n=1 Tax=Ephemerocybe angulata TaxID=980116 RepID=A0A8H6MC57_9AGAR|nr:DNA polymerase mu [Tulosesus angulatus]
MPSKRFQHSSASSSDDDRPSPRKRARRRPSSGPSGSDSGTEGKVLGIYIVQAKLDSSTINELYRLVDEHAPKSGSESSLQLELCSDVKDAQVIITAIRMRRRFERHVDWDIAKRKAIVTPEWLIESAKAGRPLPCGDFAALSELEEETIHNCPDHQEGCDCGKSNPSTQGTTRQDIKSPLNASLSVQPTDPSVFQNWRARYAVQRASPLVCPNQGLANELSILRRARELEGLEKNALAYERAIGVILEYIETGSIPEAQTTLASERYQSLSLFASIYGIGPSKARQFYDMGMRSIEDLERYYDVAPGATLKTPAELDEFMREMEAEVAFTPNGKRVRREGTVPDITVPVALALRGELDAPIPRDEVEEMRDVVMRELAELQPGCVSTIVGGYRRGKPMSNDADIVISHQDWEKGKTLIPGLCKRLCARLYQKGLVTHVMHLSGFHGYNALRTEHWDSLEKALTVFKLKPTPENPVRIHRRLDLIFALPESYWTAVIGWTGSKMFQRDLRLWAKQEKGMKFDSVALTRRHDTRRFLPKSEKEVFDILGLPWIDPTMRNADA